MLSCIAQALGLKVPAAKTSAPQLDQNEMNKLLEKTNSMTAEAMPAKGLGFAPCASVHERMPS